MLGILLHFLRRAVQDARGTRASEQIHTPDVTSQIVLHHQTVNDGIILLDRLVSINHLLSQQSMFDDGVDDMDKFKYHMP